MGYWKTNPVGRVIDVHATLKASTPKPATKAAPQTVREVIESAGSDRDAFGIQQAPIDADVRLGEAAAPTQQQIREAHRNAALDGEVSDREPTTVLDVLRAASANARAAS